MKLIFTLIVLCFSLELIAQKAGTPDSSFGVDGVLIGRSSPTTELRVTGTANDKFVAGYSLYSISGFVLSQYTNTGTVDSAFGVNGTVITTFPSGNALCEAIRTQADGKIVAAGLVGISGPAHIAMARYNPSGELDYSFGENGLVDFTLSKRTSISMQDIAIQTDNKIIVSAISDQTGDYENVIFRFNEDGSLDKSFGNNGEIFSAIDYTPEYSPLVLQPDGKFLLGGSPANSGFRVARYNPDGTLDAGFGNKGIAGKDFGTGTSVIITSLALQGNSFVLAGGEKFDPNQTPSMSMVRFTNTGIADSTFGKAGAVSTIFNNESGVNKILVQKDQKIIAAGSLSSFTDTNELIIVRYMTNGSIDSSFGINGRNLTAIQDQVSCRDALLQSNGEPLLAGTSVKYGTPQIANVTFAQYYNDTKTQKQIIVQKIKHYIQTHNNAQATTLNISIYPNPAQNSLHIEGLSSSQKTKLTVVDFNGNIQLHVVTNTSSYNLNIASLYEGNYLLKIETNGEMVTKQFVKK